MGPLMAVKQTRDPEKLFHYGITYKPESQKQTYPFKCLAEISTKKKSEIPQGQSQRELDARVINWLWSHCQFLSTFRGRGWSSLVSRWTGDEVICFPATYYSLSPENGARWPGKWEWKVEDDRNEPFSPHLPDHWVSFQWTQLVSAIRWRCEGSFQGTGSGILCFNA